MLYQIIRLRYSANFALLRGNLVTTHNGILNTIVVAILEIDKAGRIVIPKKLRDALHLTPGTRIKAARMGNSLVLEADLPEARLVIRNGLPLILPAEGADAPQLPADYFIDLQRRMHAERDRHNSGIYDDEFEG